MDPSKPTIDDPSRIVVEGHGHPKGALGITLIYLVMIIAGWCLVYFTTIQRGGTQ